MYLRRAVPVGPRTVTHRHVAPLKSAIAGGALYMVGHIVRTRVHTRQNENNRTLWSLLSFSVTMLSISPVSHAGRISFFSCLRNKYNICIYIPETKCAQ